jgi:GT2 family glycosyltransferase
MSADHSARADDGRTMLDPWHAKVAVLVLGFNDQKWLPRCLASVLATQDDNFEVFFIDNASSDGSAEYVQESFPSVKVVRNSSNLGFAGGNNEGIRAALAAGAELVFLINPDTWIDPAWLREMRAHYAADPTLDVITALILNYDDDRFDRNFLQIVSNTPDFVQDAWNGCVRSYYETITGSGAALMARRSFYEDVGVIDPEFFMYFEEIDLLRRGRYHGKRIGVSTKSIVHHFNHLESPDSGKPSKLRFERGFLIYTLKNQFDPAIKCVIKFLLEVVSRPIGAILRGEWKRAWALVRADVELIVKSPWILYRRHLEMYAPERLPEMAWLRSAASRRGHS